MDEGGSSTAGESGVWTVKVACSWLLIFDTTWTRESILEALSNRLLGNGLLLYTVSSEVD